MLSGRLVTMQQPLTRQILRLSRTNLRAVKQTAWQRPVVRRGYASAHGGHKPEGSDIPWAAGAAIVTVVGVGWVFRNGTGANGGDSHGHGHDEESHEDDAEDAESKEEDDSGEGSGTGSDEKADEGEKDDSSDDKKSKDDGKDEDKSDDGDDDEDESDDKEDKDKTKTAAGAQDKKTKGPDSKKRIPQGTAGDPDTVKKSQKGVSNTATMHSTDQMDNPGQSKKPEGAPETAKLTETIDPKR